MEAPSFKITIGNSWSLEYKYSSISLLSCSQAKKEALERQQHQMKIEVRNILKENKAPNTCDDLKAQSQVTNLVRRGVAQGLIVKDFTVKSSNMAEQKDSNKTTPDIRHNSQASTSVRSKVIKNDSADSSFDWGVVWAFTCLKLFSTESKKQTLRRDQDLLIKEAEALMKANTIAAMRTDPELRQKLQDTIEGGEARGLLVKNKTRIVGDMDEATKKANASMDYVEWKMEPVDLSNLECSDGGKAALDQQQKELYRSVVQTVDGSKVHPDYKTRIEIGRECDKTLDDITMKRKHRGLAKDPNFTPEEQRMLLNKAAEDERVVQRKARNRLNNTITDPTFITSPSQYPRELSEIQKTLGGPSSLRDRPGPALVWRQRGYQAAELEYTDQKDPEDKGPSWRPKDPLRLGPKECTTSKEKRMIHEGKKVLKGTLSGYGGSVFPELKNGEGAVPEVKDEEGQKSYS